MKRGLRKATDGSHQLVPAQLTGFGDRLPLHQFGEERSASHGRNTTLCEKSNFIDAPASYSQGEFENIAAGRILELDRGIRIGHFAGIARMLEVIKNLRRVHQKKLYRARVARTGPERSRRSPRRGF